MLCSICVKNNNIFIIEIEDKSNDAILRKLRMIVPELVWDTVFNLCVQCESDLEKAFTFKELCINSYTSWRNNRNVTDDQNRNSEDVNYNPESHEKIVGIGKDVPVESNLKKQCDNGSTVKSIEGTCTKVPCEYCGKLYTTKSILKKHYKVCVMKDRADDRNEKLDVTPEGSTQIRGEPKNINLTTCTLCGTILTNKYILRRHIQNVHASERKFRCEICERAFTSAVYLNDHKRYHTGNRSHICSNCGKGFITTSDLYHHEKIHANKRAYRCEKCPKAFNTSSDLHKHKICVHLDRSLWKYSCILCQRKFPLKINLDSHMKAHRGEKNHCCHLCERKCISKSVLRNHIMTHTNIMSLVCELCPHTYKYKKSLDHHMAKVHGIGSSRGTQSTKQSCHEDEILDNIRRISCKYLYCKS